MQYVYPRHTEELSRELVIFQNVKNDSDLLLDIKPDWPMIFRKQIVPTMSKAAPNILFLKCTILFSDTKATMIVLSRQRVMRENERWSSCNLLFSSHARSRRLQIDERTLSLIQEVKRNKTLTIDCGNSPPCIFWYILSHREVKKLFWIDRC